MLDSSRVIGDVDLLDEAELEAAATESVTADRGPLPGGEGGFFDVGVGLFEKFFFFFFFSGRGEEK